MAAQRAARCMPACTGALSSRQVRLALDHTFIDLSAGMATAWAASLALLRPYLRLPFEASSLAVALPLPLSLRRPFLACALGVLRSYGAAAEPDPATPVLLDMRGQVGSFVLQPGSFMELRHTLLFNLPPGASTSSLPDGLLTSLLWAFRLVGRNLLAASPVTLKLVNCTLVVPREELRYYQSLPELKRSLVGRPLTGTSAALVSALSPNGVLTSKGFDQTVKRLFFRAIKQLDDVSALAQGSVLTRVLANLP